MSILCADTLAYILTIHLDEDCSICRLLLGHKLKTTLMYLSSLLSEVPRILYPASDIGGCCYQARNILAQIQE